MSKKVKELRFDFGKEYGYIDKNFALKTDFINMLGTRGIIWTSVNIAVKEMQKITGILRLDRRVLRKLREEINNDAINQKEIVISSDKGYALASKASKEDFEAFVRKQAAKGFTLIRETNKLINNYNYVFGNNIIIDLKEE